MSEILLATLNARYAHTAFALRYLLANLGKLQARADLLEGTIDERPLEFVEKILARSPRILGLSVYIWNAALSLEVVRLLRRLRPQLVIVVGGPEVSYETEDQEICALADYVVTQEGDVAFARLCQELLEGRRPPERLIAGGQPEVSLLQLPYTYYSDEDLRQRVIYVEASRGCPFRCEFCLSSLDRGVRNFPLQPFLAALDQLHQRGARHFKFIDRTFNLKVETAGAILDFFLERYSSGLFLHFEMIPDRFPDELRERLTRFPSGALQFEIGIQTFDPEVADRIRRRQDPQRVEENLRFLRGQTGAHLHVDLIVGLPGESLEGFGRGFDRLVALQPQEIQVGILKRLRGTPIVRHDQEWGMVYSPSPPYEVLQTRVLPFEQLQRLRRFARYWDMVANRGTFQRVLPLLWRGGARGGSEAPPQQWEESPFSRFLHFSDWLWARTGSTHSIALPRLAELLFDYLVEGGLGVEAAARALIEDYTRGAERYLPPFLLRRGDLPPELLATPKRLKGDRPAIPRRQARHLAGAGRGSENVEL